jgi:two-component system NarL family sensor kinase
LRYRPFDIDRLISRTLPYSLVTAGLVGLYVSIVVVTTDVLSFSSPVAVTASTLAAAALFNPIRRRMQRLVDWFNRTSYDAESTVATFSARLRESIDLDAVRADLLDVVARAVEPTHAVVWVARRPG